MILRDFLESDSFSDTVRDCLADVYANKSISVAALDRVLSRTEVPHILRPALAAEIKTLIDVAIDESLTSSVEAAVGTAVDNYYMGFVLKNSRIMQIADPETFSCIYFA
jgi:phage baseplate assembly protein W